MKKLLLNNHIAIFILSCFIILVISILYLSKETDAKFETITTAKETNKKLDKLLSSCYEMEASARGYSLTNEVAVAETYNKAKRKLNYVTNYISDTKQASDLELFYVLDELIIKRIALLDSQISIVDSLSSLSNLDKELIIEGDALMDKIRIRVSKFKHKLELKIDNEEASLTTLQNSTILFIILLAFFACIFVIVSYYRLSKLSKNNENLNDILKGQKVLLDEAESISNSGSWKWNLQTNETFCSNGTYQIFEIDPKKEVIDFEVFTSIIHEDDRKRISNELIEATTKGLPYVIEHKIKTRKNTEKIVQSIGKPIITENGITNYFGSIRDITMIKEQEKELLRRNDELEVLNQELEQFAYVASHDLQEPLRKIRMFSNLLEDEFENEDASPYITRIRDGAERMQQLIKDLLNFSRVSRNIGDNTSVNLNDTIETVLDDLSIKIEEEHATVKVDKFEYTINANQTHMSQLFQNLISNAIKFTDKEKKPVISIKNKKISKNNIDIPFESTYTNFIEIKVTDNGIGFSEEYKEQIFTIFQRLHGRNEYEGTGIGLAICNKICENHGGTIQAHSVKGEGSTFTIYLPLNS